MKLLTIILFLFPICTSNLAQGYKSVFSNDTTRWNIFEIIPDAGGTVAFFSFSDTIYEDNKYHLIFREEIYSYDQAVGEHPNILGYIHEDTILGCLWFTEDYVKNPIGVKLMDLSLNLGDTVNLYDAFSAVSLDKAVVDSIYFVDEMKVIEFDYYHYDCCDSYKLKFIEGVGATNGLGLSYISPLESTLLCKINGTELSYSLKREWINNCFEEGGGGFKLNESSSLFIVSPNPVADKVTVESNTGTSGIKDLRIYDIQGRILYHLSCNELNITVNISNLDQGLYLMLINNTQTELLIKNGY